MDDGTKSGQQQTTSMADGGRRALEASQIQDWSGPATGGIVVPKASPESLEASAQESETALRNVMKTVADSFSSSVDQQRGTGRPQQQQHSSLDSGDEPPSPGAESTRSSRSSNLIEQFMSEMDLVFSEILAEEDMRVFRHGMQTASDASSQDLALNSTPDDSTPETTRKHLLFPQQQQQQQQHKTQSTLLVSYSGGTAAASTPPSPLLLPASAPPLSSAAPSASTPDHAAARKKRPRMVVPLAVLEEFSEGSSSREVWSADELSEGPCAPRGGGGRASGSSSEEDEEEGRRSAGGSSENNADASSMVESTSPTNAVRARRNAFRRSRSHQKSMNGPIAATPTVHGGGGGGGGGDSCIVDLNSNAKDSLLSGESPRRTYEELERLVLSDPEDSDSDGGVDLLAGGCGGGGGLGGLLDAEESSAKDDESAMLRFAEKYFNSHHVIHLGGYPNAITKTMNIVTRKSLNEVVPVEDLVRFTKNSSIPFSHVRFMDTNCTPIACSMFKDIHRYMRGGGGGGGDQSKGVELNHHSVIRSVFAQCIEHVELRDEIICQIVRLLTDNPSEEMRLRLWPLLAVAVTSFSPSTALRKALIGYLRRVVRSEEKHDDSCRPSSYARYCLSVVVSSKRRKHCRKFPPSAAEFEALCNLQPLLFRIHFLDGKTKTVATEHSDTIDNVIGKVAEKIGLQNASGWALYESVPEHDRYIRNDEYLADILSDWEEKQRVTSTLETPKKCSPKIPSQSYGKLVMCKRFCQRISEIGDDPVELRLLYAQAVHYVVHLDEFQAPMSASLHLAGLQAQADYGHYDEGKVSRYSEPEEMLCQRVLLSDGRDWSQELAAAHKRYGKGKSMVDAMKKYLTIVSQFPLYGCTKVFAHYRGVWPYGIETVLAVNYDGFKLISIQEKKIIFDLCYSEIDELVLKERHGECHAVVLLKNSVAQIRQKTFLFECLELDELAALIESYSPKHATWTHDPVKAWRKYEFVPTDNWHRLYDNILKCRQILVQTGFVKRPPHSEVGFLRSAFNRISGRNCTSSSRHDHELEMEDFNEIAQCSHWMFSKLPFKTSLLAGQSHEIEDVAVRMFNSTLVYTGLELSTALDDMDLVVVVQTLITKCMENDNLCNEFYLQLIKQTTDSKSCGSDFKVKAPLPIEGSLKAMRQYWHLMTMANCVMLPPSTVVFTYLNLHLRRLCLLSHMEEGKFSQFCLKSLRRTFENGGRKYPPSYKEILFVTKRQPIEGRVFLADGHPMLIEFDSAATATEVIEVIKAKAGLRLDADGFALFQCIGEREEFIAPTTKLADCLYQWEKSSRSNHSSSKDLKLLFKKRIFIEPFMNLKDPVEIDLLYNQSVTDVFEQKIPLTKMDAIHLCALRAQAEYGDHGHSNTIDYNSVVRILPRHLRDLMVLPEISSIHRTLMSISPLVANIAFLEILKQWPLYGAVLYEVSHSGLDFLPKTLWLAVSQLGLHLMEFRGQTVYSTYPFEDICECSPTNKTLTITVSNDTQMMFFTSEGNQIVQLISDYREVLAQRRKERLCNIEATCLPDVESCSSDPQKVGSHLLDQWVSNSINQHRIRHKPAKHHLMTENFKTEPLVEVSVKIDHDDIGSQRTSPDQPEQSVGSWYHSVHGVNTSGKIAGKISSRIHSRYRGVRQNSRHANNQSVYQSDTKPEEPYD